MGEPGEEMEEIQGGRTAGSASSGAWGGDGGDARWPDSWLCLIRSLGRGWRRYKVAGQLALPHQEPGEEMEEIQGGRTAGSASSGAWGGDGGDTRRPDSWLCLIRSLGRRWKRSPGVRTA